MIPFLTAEKAAEVRERFGTPCYVYDRAALEAAARRLLDFRAPYGFTLRYAMKANPSRGSWACSAISASTSTRPATGRWSERSAWGSRPRQIQLTSQMPSPGSPSTSAPWRAVERLLAAAAGGLSAGRPRARPSPCA